MRRLPVTVLVVAVFGVGLVMVGAAGLATSEQVGVGGSIDTVIPQATPDIDITGGIGADILGGTATTDLELAVADDNESVTLDVDETAPATVIATRADGTTETVTGPATIESGDSGIVSIDNDTVSAETAGTTTITAEYADQTATVEVTVDDPAPSPPPGSPAPSPPPSPDIDVTIADLPDPVTTDQTLAVETQLANDGSGEEIAVELRLDGTTVSTESLIVPGDETITATLDYDLEQDDVGDREITVAAVGEDTTSTSVSVLPPAGISAVIDVEPGTISVGDTITLSGADSTTQRGTIETYEWNVAGDTLEGETVSVAAEQAGTINVELTVYTDTGESVTTTTTVEVLEPDDPEAEAGTPLWPVAVAITGLLVAGLTWWYLRDT